jgi:PEP-CTERM motif
MLMNGLRKFDCANGRAGVAALLTSLALLAGPREVRAVDTEAKGLVYHAQVTSYYCGSATVEMMLDNNAVRQNNPYVNYILNPANAPDPAPASFVNVIPGQDATFGKIPFNAVNNANQSIHPTYAPVVIAGLNGGNPVSAVTYGPQLAIYDFAHGAGTFVPIAGPNAGKTLSYFNPFQGWGSGSGINGQQVELNVFDNPDVGGEGSHAFAAYNLPTLNAASRTIANALGDYEVPAGGVFYGGQHAMAVTGVKTDVKPGKNVAAYEIEGFYVDDPWHGYAVAKHLPADQLGLKQRYVTNKPEKNVALTRWQDIFTASAGEPGEGAYASGVGYKFVVEPQGPELPDDGSFDSQPLEALPLLTDLDATGALALAQTTLAADLELSSKYGLSGGGFDGNHMTLIDPATENDWFIPYLRGGVYTGAFLFSAHYGILEEASWDDLGDLPTSLADLEQEYQGIEDGIHPNDNPVPEASTLALVGIGWVVAGAKRRRRGA